MRETRHERSERWRSEGRCLTCGDEVTYVVVRGGRQKLDYCQRCSTIMASNAAMGWDSPW